jgi:hypothetical protein
MAKRSKQDLSNPEYDIGGLGPHTNSTYGYFQYLVCDDIRIDNEGFFNKATIDNNLLVKKKVKATNVSIGTFEGNEFTETCTMQDLCSEISRLKTAVAALQSTFLN